MQTQKQSYQNYQNTPQSLSRNPSGKLSYSPGHWKNYLPTDILRNRPQQSRSSYESTNRFPSPGGGTVGTVGNNSYYQQMAQREEKERKKQQMLKRVKQIQERVMPLIQNDYNHKEEDISWRVKMEQKVAKLETAVDAIEKSLEIKMEKQVLELQKKMQQRYIELEARLAKNRSGEHE